MSNLIAPDSLPPIVFMPQAMHHTLRWGTNSDVINTEYTIDSLEYVSIPIFSKVLNQQVEEFYY